MSRIVEDNNGQPTIIEDEPIVIIEDKGYSVLRDDALLTNVIVPILEHIKRHDEDMVAQAEVEGELVLEYFYSRRMVDLDHVQDILKEWRG